MIRLPFVCGKYSERKVGGLKLTFLVFFLFGFLASSVFVTAIDPASVSDRKVDCPENEVQSVAFLFYCYRKNIIETETVPLK